MAKQTAQYYGTGRRKTASARVFLRPGAGRILVNKREIENYFPRETLRMDLKQPFGLTGTDDQYDVYVTVRGGAEGTGAERVETVAVWCRRRPEVEDVGEHFEVGRSGAHPRLYRARREQ